MLNGWHEHLSLERGQLRLEVSCIARQDRHPPAAASSPIQAWVFDQICRCLCSQGSLLCSVGGLVGVDLPLHALLWRLRGVQTRKLHLPSLSGRGLTIGTDVALILAQCRVEDIGVAIGTRDQLPLVLLHAQALQLHSVTVGIVGPTGGVVGCRNLHLNLLTIAGGFRRHVLPALRRGVVRCVVLQAHLTGVILVRAGLGRCDAILPRLQVCARLNRHARHQRLQLLRCKSLTGLLRVQDQTGRSRISGHTHHVQQVATHSITALLLKPHCFRLNLAHGCTGLVILKPCLLQARNGIPIARLCQPCSDPAHVGVALLIRVLLQQCGQCGFALLLQFRVAHLLSLFSLVGPDGDAVFVPTQRIHFGHGGLRQLPKRHVYTSHKPIFDLAAAKQARQRRHPIHQPTQTLRPRTGCVNQPLTVCAGP